MTDNIYPLTISANYFRYSRQGTNYSTFALSLSSRALKVRQPLIGVPRGVVPQLGYQSSLLWVMCPLKQHRTDNFPKVRQPPIGGLRGVVPPSGYRSLLLWVTCPLTQHRHQSFLLNIAAIFLWAWGILRWLLRWCQRRCSSREGQGVGKERQWGG